METALAAPAPSTELVRGYLDATIELVRLGDPSTELLFARSVEAAQRAAQAHGDREGNDRVRVEVIRAEVLLAAGRADEAEESLAAAISACPAARQTLAWAWQVRGGVALARCELEGALSHLVQAIERYRGLAGELRGADGGPRSDEDAVWWTFHTIGLEGALAERAKALVRTGRLDQAALAIQAEAHVAAELEAAAPGTSNATMLAQNRVFLALASEDFEGARALAEDVLVRHREAFESDPALYAVRDLFVLYRCSALHELAREHRFDARLARGELEALLARESIDAGVRRDALLQLADLATWTQDRERAARALDQLDAAPLPADPADLCTREEETARAIALRARLALETGAAPERLVALRDALGASYERVLARWESDRPADGRTGFLHWGTSRLVPSALIRLELALDPSPAGLQRAFAVVLRTQALGTLARRLAAGEIDLDDVRAHLLVDGIGLLVWLPSIDRSHVFRVDADRVEHAELPQRDALLVAVAAYTEAVAERPARSGEAGVRARELERLGVAVRELLVPRAWRSHVELWRGLYVSGLDLLADAPLECLPWDGPRPLGAVRAVCRLPSIPAGVALARRRARAAGATPQGEIALVAAPALAPDASDPKRARFELARDDVQSTWSASADEGSRILLGEDASCGGLAALDLGLVRRLEIVTHGVFDPARELPAGLALTPSKGDAGILWSETIEALPSVPPLVALWACGSARGQVRLGDDSAAHLAGSFLLRGADVVVVNRGQVSLRATLALARAYDRELRARRSSPAEALRAARARLLEEKTYADPWYHGSTVMLGLGLAPPLR